MILDKEKIKHVAKLSKLKFSDSELKKVSQQLSAILEYVKLLDEVNTSDVKETAQTMGLKNVYREDEPQKENCLTQEEVLANAPEGQDGFVRFNHS